jgi:hypothetical protein
LSRISVASKSLPALDFNHLTLSLVFQSLISSLIILSDSFLDDTVFHIVNQQSQNTVLSLSLSVFEQLGHTIPVSVPQNHPHLLLSTTFLASSSHSEIYSQSHFLALFDKEHTA